MTEQELRALVRSIVADRLSGSSPQGSTSRRVAPPTAPPSLRPPSSTALGAAWSDSAVAHQVSLHVSHGRFRLPPDSEGQCLIEPGVTCNHCGFCESYGH